MNRWSMLGAVFMGVGMAACSATADPKSGSTSGETASSNDKANPAVEQRAVDQEIVGQWYAGRGGTRMSYDGATGRFGTPSGTGLLFAFSADGTYVKGFQSIESGSCTMGYLASESGTFNTTERELMLHPSKGNLHVISCSGQADTDQSLDVTDETLTWSLGPSTDGTNEVVLTLTNESGASSEFERVR